MSTTAERNAALLGTDATPLPVLLRHWAACQGDQPALTFVDHAIDPGGVATTLTWTEFDQLVDAIAAWIRPRCATGDRVAILVEQSVHYVAAFLAVLRAGRIAVPLYPPGLPRFDERLAAVLADCAPAMLLTTSARVADVERFVAARELGVVPAVPVDALPKPGNWSEVTHDPDDIAYLQYTSGSTRTPAGVILTHANVFANASQAVECFELTLGRSVCVSWLPLFHDMGLMLGTAAALVGGVPVVLLDPGAFLERPVRWLRALSANPGAITAAPSFAYAYTAARTTAAERTLLRLDDVDVLIDGSEPVVPANIDRFHDTFAECGLRRDAHRPSYGLAEATVLVTTSPPGAEPSTAVFDAETLAAGTAAEPVPGRRTSTLVSCGMPVGQQVQIVNPVTGMRVGDGTVGEVWVSGPNVATGYWRQPELSSRRVRPAAGRGCAPVTSAYRPTVSCSSPAASRTSSSWTAATTTPRTSSTRSSTRTPRSAGTRRRRSRSRVPIGNSLWCSPNGPRTPARTPMPRSPPRCGRPCPPSTGSRVHDLVLLDPGAVPRTSSGKISRSACRAQYLARETRS